MASQDMHSRQQQRPQVEARLKTLVNNDLKDICKAYGLPVSGTKMILQKRCIGCKFSPSRKGMRCLKCGVCVCERLFGSLFVFFVMELGLTAFHFLSQCWMAC